MKLRSMEEKISYRLFLMGFLGLIFTAALCIFVFHKAFTAQAWSGLERETDLVRAGYEQTGDPTQLSAFVTDDLRVTLISRDGNVLFESATDQPMENHLTRPEIRDAIANGEGRDIRDSQTMGYETYYYAVRLSGGDVLRVAQDAETVWSIYDATIPAIVLSCVALMLAAAVLAALLTKALVQPVLNMTEDLDHIQDKVPYKELIPFAESIHALLNFFFALRRAHEVERNALARSCCVIPGVGRDLVPFAGHACDLIGVRGDLFADGVERCFCSVLLQDIEDLLGRAIPRSVVKGERDDLFAVGVGVVVHQAVIDLFLGDLLNGLARFRARAGHRFAILASQENVESAILASL